MIVKKPTIIIYTRNADESLLREVCAGIEEESVLFELVPMSTGEAGRLSAEAAEASMLGAGIGICGREISLHIRGMNVHTGTDEKTSLFHYHAPDAETARNLGASSARVIKKKPLRL